MLLFFCFFFFVFCHIEETFGITFKYTNTYSFILYLDFQSKRTTLPYHTNCTRFLYYRTYYWDIIRQTFSFSLCLIAICSSVLYFGCVFFWNEINLLISKLDIIMEYFHKITFLVCLLCFCLLFTFYSIHIYFSA